MNTLQTRQLIQAIANDDRQAFKRFFDRFYPRLYRLAFHYVRSDVLSEELVSDVFLKIWNSRKKLPEIEQLELYFFRSVKNQALTYLKRESRGLPANADSVRSTYIEYNQPESLYLANELAAKIEAAISQLPEKCEIIFRLVREDGLRYKEVAQLLDISPKTVENQMHIALQKLRVALHDYQRAEAVPSYIPGWHLLLIASLLG